MKKYKIHWSIFNLLAASQEEVVKLQQIVKGLMSAGIVTTWLETDATYGMFAALGAGCLDMFIGCFYFEEKKPETPENNA